MMNRSAKLSLALVVLGCSGPLSAQTSSGLSSDCDVPADHYSSVSQDLGGFPAISGTVRLVQMRSGENLPVAGANIVSSDGKFLLGFQLIARSTRSKQFDVVFNVHGDGDPKSVTVAQVPIDTPIPFTLSVSDAGKARLVMGSKTFESTFVAITGSRGMAFCSTAQFKFSELTFSPG